jgi:hypothetical protein
MSSPDTKSLGDTFFKKCIQYFEKDSVQASLRGKVIDPILRHILNKIFPYIVLICVMFVMLLLAVLITLGVIIFQVRGPAVTVPLTNG